MDVGLLVLVLHCDKHRDTELSLVPVLSIKFSGKYDYLTLVSLKHRP